VGQRGPKPLPANVHRLRDNPGHRPLHELTESLQPEVEIPGCPPHLLKEARKEWKRITPELERYGLISKIDRAALALYCQAWAHMVYAELQLQRAVAAAEKARAAAEERNVAYVGGDGYTILTPNGHLGYSPYWVMKNKAADQVDKFLAAFGMSPSSRGRVNASNTRQRGLFDDPNAPSSFGDI